MTHSCASFYVEKWIIHPNASCVRVTQQTGRRLMFVFICPPVEYVVSGIEQWLSAWTNQLTSHSRKVNEFPPCADFPFVSLRWHTEGIFNCALAVLQGQVDLMAFQSASICPGGGGGLLNSHSVLLSVFFFFFFKELRLELKEGLKLLSLQVFLILHTFQCHFHYLVSLLRWLVFRFQI